MKQRIRQPIPASSRRTFFKPEAAAVQPKISCVFLPESVLLTFGSLNIVYPRGIMFTQPFWKTIFRLPKPPSHQIRPASRQIIPIPLHQNALKETYFLYFSALECFIVFFNCLRFSHPNLAKTARKSNSARRLLVCPIPHSA